MRKSLIVVGAIVFLFFVSSCMRNSPPIIDDLYADIPEGSMIFASDTVAFMCNASDPDEDDELVYNWEVPTGGAFLTPTDSSALVWVVPGEEGSYTLTCEVSDLAGDADTGSVTIDVSVNKRPQIDSIVGLNLATAGDTVEITCYASDADTGQELTYMWEASAGSFVEPSGESDLFWVAPDHSGVFDIICTVSDGMAQTNDTLPVTVQNYFPLDLGYNWLYTEEIDFVVFVDTVYLRTKVVDNMEDADRNTWFVQRKFYDTGEFIDTVYDTMQYITSEDSLIIDDPGEEDQYLGLLFPLWVGKSWDIGDGTMATVTQNGLLSLPAGIFTDCMRVQLDGDRQPDDYWFAPDVGVVQVGMSMDTADLVFELTDYDLR